jgi:hypothetical protein
MPMLRSYANTPSVKVKKQLPSHFKQVATSTDLGLEFEKFLGEELDEELGDDDDSDHFQTYSIFNDFVSFVPIRQQHQPKYFWDCISWYSRNLYLRNRNLRL